MAKTSAKQRPYEEGTWFAVPLPSRGYAAGIVVRRSPTRDHVLIGYFFGPRRETPPRLEEVCSLKVGDAIACIRCGDRGILKEGWLVVGAAPDFERARWPMSVYTMKPSLTEMVLSVRYDESNPAVEIERAPVESLTEYSAGLAGSGFVEAKLDSLLGGGQVGMAQVKT